MLNHFTFNGKSTANYGLLVSAVNPYDAPSRKVEKVEIPYRNGDLLIDTGTYNNVLVSYDVSIMDNTKAKADAVRNWLLSSTGYHELSDTINADTYRVGCYYTDIEYALTSLYRYGTCRITFDCLPQRYLLDNDAINLSAGTQTLTAEYFNEPIITVPTAGNITVNGLEIAVNSAPVVINTQTKQCYYGDTNMNSEVELDDFPVFNIGSNTIVADMALTIVPNWWKL